jgi:uncharacterized membrane protein
MADLNQAKNIGGVGAILTILSVVPSVGPLLSIVGLVLVLLALKWISEIVQNPAIFRNALIAVVVAIVGVAIGAVVGGVGVFSVLTGVGAGGPNGMDFARLFTTIIIALVVVWLFAVVSAVFFRRSLNLTGDHLNVKMFRTAGLLVLIGAVLTIVIVGAVISLVANILLAVAFFQIRASPPPPPPPPPSS